MSDRSIRSIVANLGQDAKIQFPVHPHMLRHSTGFYLANKGMDTRSIQAYMGHASITNTVLYTHLNVDRYKDFWQDL